MPVQFATRPEIDDAARSRLHARAFGGPCVLQPCRKRLCEHSLTWGRGKGRARRARRLRQRGLGRWRDAFVLDLVVDPDHQRRGLGEVLVERAAREAAAAGCQWLHVDFEARLGPFYLDACGFQPTAAGLLRLEERSP